MSVCQSCGGIIGRDCFNPVECQWITDRMEAEQQRQAMEAVRECGDAEAEVARLRDILNRIALDYPVVAGPNECPPAPHACSKCEIYHLLDEYADDRKEQTTRLTDTICDSVKELLS